MSAAVVTFDRAELHAAVEWVAKVVPHRPPAPILGAVRLTLTTEHPAGPGIVVAGFDYETSHTAHVPADGLLTDPADVLVPGHLARDFLGSLRGKTVDIEIDDHETAVFFTTGRTRLRLPVLPLEDYPTLPPDADPVATVEAADLVALCRATWFACGRDEMLPNLTGAHLRLHDTELVMVTTNRFTIGRRTCTVDPKGPDATLGDTGVLLPAKPLGTAAAGLRGPVELGADTSSITLATTSRRVTLRRLDLEFPRLDSLIPDYDTCPTRIEVDAPALAEALKRATLALERNTAVLLVVDPDEGIRLESTNAGTTARDVVDAGIDGDPLEQGFNPLYLADALTSAGTEHVQIGLRPAKPALIRAGDYTAVVMPRRVL